MTDFVLLTSDWYRLNARVLPWRSTKNAYFIWLSEIILQQTRVEQGLSYYQNFTKQFPTVHDLANAEESAVLKLWQGLGYYSRARNLHATAKQIVNEFQGEFPADFKKLLSLKGVGPYTAAAIASFAFDLPHAVVDGNVYRILSRFYGIDEPIDSSTGKKIFQELADSLIPHDQPALFNQAIMEFGSKACTPSNPDCNNCVLVELCASGKSGLAAVRPVKSKKTAVRNRFFHYFHVVNEEKVLIKKRTQKDLWQELFEFPMLETDTNQLSPEELNNFGILRCTKVFENKHILSHQHIYASFYFVQEGLPVKMEDYTAVSELDFQEFPIHRLMEKYWESRG